MQDCVSNVCTCKPSFTGPNCAWPRFEGLGDPGGIGGSGAGLSSDGTIVTGTNYTASDDSVAFIWTKSSGYQTLQPATNGVNHLRGHDISGNGLVIVGATENVPVFSFRWTMAGGAVQMTTLAMSGFTVAEAVNTDGSVIVGRANKGNGTPEYPVRWLNGSPSVVPGFSGTQVQGQAYDVSDDGNVVVGNSNLSPSHQVPFKWTVGTASATRPNDADGNALAVSGNGSVVVGYSGTAPPYTAWRWTSTGISNITPPGFTNPGWPADTNFDGSVVIGSGVDSAGNSQAWIWDATNGARALTAALTALGINYSNWNLPSVSAISKDGKVIIGSGSPQGGTTSQGWIVRLP
jgi:uncharacterized membrane protein